MCGCRERRQLMGQMAKNIVRGQPITPQVKRFNQTVREDLAAVKRAVTPRFIRGR